MTPPHNNPQGTTGCEQPARQPQPDCIHYALCCSAQIQNASGCLGKKDCKFYAVHTSAPAPEHMVSAYAHGKVDGAKDAREQVLTELYLLAEDMISDGQRMIQEEPMGKLYGKGKVSTASVFQMRIESLRSQQEAEQPKEQPR